VEVDCGAAPRWWRHNSTRGGWVCLPRLPVRPRDLSGSGLGRRHFSLVVAADEFRRRDSVQQRLSDPKENGNRKARRTRKCSDGVPWSDPLNREAEKMHIGCGRGRCLFACSAVPFPCLLSVLMSCAAPSEPAFQTGAQLQARTSVRSGTASIGGPSGAVRAEP
jgi:hypothetical protein